MKNKRIEIICVTISILIFVSFFTIFKPVKINGNAMSPIYNNGDRWLVVKIIYQFVKPKRSDVIMFEYQSLPNYRYIGRIVGLPKEKVMIKNGKVFINNVKLQEDYLHTGTTTKTIKPIKLKVISDSESKLVETDDKKLFEEGIEVLIPENQYFILADNRDNSADSRSLGFVSEKDIIGHLYLRY